MMFLHRVTIISLLSCSISSTCQTELFPEVGAGAIKKKKKKSHGRDRQGLNSLNM